MTAQTQKNIMAIDVALRIIASASLLISGPLAISLGNRLLNTIEESKEKVLIVENDVKYLQRDVESNTTRIKALESK